MPVRGDANGAAVLDHAPAMARRFNAHLNVVHGHVIANADFPVIVVD